MTFRICIDARIEPGFVGGVEQVIMGLATGYASLDFQDFELTFLASSGMAEQLRPLFTGNPRLSCEIVELPRMQRLSDRLDQMAGRRLADKVKRAIYRVVGRRIFGIPRDQDLADTQRFDLFHFPNQQAFWTDKPNIYHPHDLQHLHLPQYFTSFTRISREYRFRAFCQQATIVAAASTWIKQDLIAKYGLAPDKVKVIPLAPPNQNLAIPGGSQIEDVKRHLALPDNFIFYPAQTWEHKNHIRLIGACARLRDVYGLNVPLVLSGKLTPFKRELDKEILRLGLGDSVRFLGFVSPTELQALYHLCTAVVIPSLYEAASFPMWEAYIAGAATACASTTSLPRQAKDASLIFDPLDVNDLSHAIFQLWTDGELRTELAEKGRKRVSRFTWETTCSQFLALYRKLLDLELSPEDARLLNCEPRL